MVKKDSFQHRVSRQGDRKINQDRCEILQHESIKVLALADGMGGHPRGEVAAQFFIDTCYHLLKRSDPGNFSPEQFIRDAFRMAHQKILSYGKKQDPQIFPRSTAALVVIKDNLMTWSHLGDSRIYLFRHGRAHMRTMDHTQSEELRRSSDEENPDILGKISGRGGVTRCLGGSKKVTQVEITPAIPLQEDDIIMICSDGVWSQLGENELENFMLQKDLSLTSRLNDLVEKSVNNRHPNSDNATAVGLQWQSQKHEKPVEQVQPEQLDDAISHLQNLINQQQ